MTLVCHQYYGKSEVDKLNVNLPLYCIQSISDNYKINVWGLRTEKGRHFKYFV